MTDLKANESRPNGSLDGLETLPGVVSSVSEIAPYSTAAFPWKNAGWKSALPIGYVNKETAKAEGTRPGWHPRRKSNPPAGYTGGNAAVVSSQDIGAWSTDKPGACNIGIYMHPEQQAIGVDLDREGAREEMESLAGVTFPDTWSSTARGEGSFRRILFFKATLPEGRKWKNHPVVGVDSIHANHRYAVVHPSIHPNGSQYMSYDPEGELYEGPIPFDEIADLPPGLVAFLSEEGKVLSGADASDDEVRAALESFRGGAPCPYVAGWEARELERLGRAEDRGNGQGIHDPSPIRNVLGYGFEGHRGVGAALATQREAHIKAATKARGWTEAAADNEWWAMVNSGVAKLLTHHQGEIAMSCNHDPIPDFDFEFPDDTEVQLEATPNLPDSFWEARPALKHIRAAAHSRGRSADAAFYTVMARLAAMSSHELLFENSLGKGSLNLFVAVVAASGVGKSSGVSVGRELMAAPRYLTDDLFRDNVPIGSGEGLAEAFMGIEYRATGEKLKTGPRQGEDKTEKVRAQVRHNAFIYVDEGQALTQQSSRQGATIGPVLRQAWVGETLGQQNANAENTRIVKEGTYSLGLVIGYQMGTAKALLDEVEVDAGTPQRFIWCAAADPTIPERRTEHPGPLVFPQHPLESEGGFDEWLIADMPRKGLITFPSEVDDWLYTRNVQRARGEVVDAPLDSHMSLMLCKLAALLALLDGRLAVDMADWALAGQMWASSVAMRSEVLAHTRDAQAAEREARMTEKEEETMRMETARTAASDIQERVAAGLTAKLKDKGPMRAGALMRTLRGDKRWTFDAALARTIKDGRIREEGGLYSAG